MGKEPQNRDEVLVRTLEILSDGIPRMAKEICWEIRRLYGWTLLNKSMINSVLHKEGKLYVRYDGLNFTYRIR